MKNLYFVFLRKLQYFQTNALFFIIISNYTRLNTVILLYLKDHQVGEEHHWSQVIQGLKLAVPASGVGSWIECLTTQIGDSMAWELWDASLGKFKL
jgi:hypothetical protein